MQALSAWTERLNFVRHLVSHPLFIDQIRRACSMRCSCRSVILSSVQCSASRIGFVVSKDTRALRSA